MQSLWLGTPVALAVSWITLRYLSVDLCTTPSKAHLATVNSIAGNPEVTKAALSTTKIVPFLRFVKYFLINSFKGAIDVSIRAMSPSLAIEPHLIHYPFNNDSPLRTVAFVNTLSLMPGTIGAQIKHDYIVVHVLNQQGNINKQLQALEAIINPLFDYQDNPKTPDLTGRQAPQHAKHSCE
ncbi:MAG TPA: Na+/H+ antiporter subunit E [Marinagarivorans sp.]